jgi:hypothetical protein
MLPKKYYCLILMRKKKLKTFAKANPADPPPITVTSKCCPFILGSIKGISRDRFKIFEGISFLIVKSAEVFPSIEEKDFE